MEMTRDKIEWLAKQPIISEFAKIRTEEVVDIAKQLLAEMDKPKVWDGIDSKRNYAIVYTCETDTGIYTSNGKKYTRSLPKSPVREIAEKYDGLTYINRQGVPCKVSDTIEAAIKEALEKAK